MGDSTPVQIKLGEWEIDVPNLWSQKLTLVHPFFGESERFKIQLGNWCRWPEKLKESVQIIVVDDHGTPAITDLLTPNKVKYIDFDLTVLRVTDDLKWSTPGALNLGIMSTGTNWVLIMDSDCLFEVPEMEKILNLRPDPGWAVKFPRHRITNDKQWAKNVRYLPCTILFHKDMFLDINGFDEDFIGSFSTGYGFFDNHFDHKARVAGYHIGQIASITATEYMDDFVGPRIKRDHGRDHRINKDIMYAKIRGEQSLRMNMLNFNWEVAWRHRR